MLHTKKFKKALEIYKKLLKISTNNQKTSIYNGIGNVFRMLAETSKDSMKYNKKALSYYKKAINSNAKYKGLYFSNASYIYGKLKMWDDAIKTSKKAIYLLKKEEKEGIKHGNQIKILELENSLYKEYKKKTQ